METGKAIEVSVGAVVFRDDEVLVIKRGRAPFAGHWSIPGGKVEYGERLQDAVRREVREETGLEIEVIALLDVFDATPREANGEFLKHGVIVDYVAEWVSGEPQAGDDAADAEFVDFDTAIARMSWDVTREAITRAAEIRQAVRKGP